MLFKDLTDVSPLQKYCHTKGVLRRTPRVARRRLRLAARRTSRRPSCGPDAHRRTSVSDTGKTASSASSCAVYRSNDSRASSEGRSSCVAVARRRCSSLRSSENFSVSSCRQCCTHTADGSHNQHRRVGLEYMLE